MKLFHKMFFTVFVGMMFVGNVFAEDGVSYKSFRNNISNPQFGMYALGYVCVREFVKNETIKVGADTAGLTIMCGGTPEQIMVAGIAGMGAKEVSDISFVGKMIDRIPYCSKDTKVWLGFVGQRLVGFLIGKYVGGEVSARIEQAGFKYEKSTRISG